MSQRLKWLAMLVGLAGLAALTDFGSAAPVKGPISGYQKIEAGSKLRFALTYKGGERACVIVKGDRDPPVNLTISVFELKEDPATKRTAETLVAKDDLGTDLCSVIWYPPRTGPYAVEISSDSPVWNKIWLAVK
jgi:hypothetical protein